MGSLIKRPWSIKVKLVISLMAINLAGTAIFAGLAYRSAETRSLADIDSALCSAAEGIRTIVPTLVIAEAEGEHNAAFVSAYHEAHDKIEQYTEAARLEFLYAIVVKADGSAYELMGNLSPEQQSERVDPVEGLLLKPYELSPVMVESAAAMDQRIDVDTDEYGTFRSCLIPVRWADGRVVMFGADMEISDVDRQLREDLVANITNGIIVLIGVITIVILFSNRISNELREVVKDANAISRLRLGQPGPRMVSNTLEVDLLLWSLDDMKKGLRAFSKYVPDAVIGQVLAKGAAEVGGERRELSLLMTDVADFTTISEQLEPERVMVVMSEYFDRVVSPLLEEKATVDKYVGDAIFTYWNAPVQQPDHGARACRAALRARRASERLAAEWQETGRWPWKTRFGLHAGETVFGNVGAPDRMDFTVIGSSVNLAARLEGLNKFYGTEILASGRLRTLAGDGFLFRAVDYALPKGALEPMEIFELRGAFGIADFEPTQEDIDFVRLWEAAISLYRARDFQAALPAFEVLAKRRLDDPVAKLYVKRAAEFMAWPPPADWDGVTRYDSK